RRVRCSRICGDNGAVDHKVNLLNT
ncbi:hypothetical protein D030_3102B, partial [Vibrio parahaemolyticus AQ3810]